MEKLQINVGGMHCSFCQESIRRAYKNTEGVQTVAVNVAHEEALIEYDPAKRTPTELRDTLRQIGYSVRDTDKVRAYEEIASEHPLARAIVAAAQERGLDLLDFADFFKHPLGKRFLPQLVCCCFF